MIDLPNLASVVEIDPDDLFTLDASARRQRHGKEMKLLVDDPATTAHVDTSLARLVTRAHAKWGPFPRLGVVTVNDT